MEDSDLALALQLQEQFFDDSNVHTNVKEDREHKQSTDKAGDRSISLVDPYWETADPIPDIRALFLEFNERFFWGRLAGIEVKWSPRMTSCAGVCCYEGGGGLCSVRLSVPLLKLRPRKDLVETLLHEMIHAYLFVTDNNKDHDGHGPEFHKHMYRINKETGTKISVYHNFHDEVDLYKQHWWRCDGPCRSRKPYFGWVKRAMNRAPSKNDTWWDMHEKTCGGKYTKVKEPEDYGKKKQKKTKDEVDMKTKGKPTSVISMDIRIFGGTGKTLSQPKSTESVNKPRDTARAKPTATVTSGSKHTGIANKHEDATRREPSATITSISKPAESVNKSGDTSRPKPVSTFSDTKSSKSVNKPGNGVKPNFPFSNSNAKTLTPSPIVSTKAVASADGAGISGWLKGKAAISTPKESSSKKKEENSFITRRSSSAGDNPVKKSVFHDSDFSDSDDELLGSMPLDDIIKTSEVTSNRSQSSLGVSRGSIDASKGKANVCKELIGASKGNVATSDNSINLSKGISSEYKETINGSDELVNSFEGTSNSDGKEKVNDNHKTNNSDDLTDVRAMLRRVWGQKHIGKSTSTSVVNNVADEKRNSLDIHKVPSRKRLSDDFEYDVKNTKKTCRSDEHDKSNADNKNSSIFNKSNVSSNRSTTERIKSSDTGRIKEPNLARKMNDGGSSTGDTGTTLKGGAIGVDSDKTKRYGKSIDKHDDVSVDGAKSRGDNSANVVEINSTELSTCPVCNKDVPVSTINDHLDLCLTLMAIS